MKLIGLLLLSTVFFSCSNYSELLQGNWQFVNENGATRTLTITGDQWNSEYCFKRFLTDQQWRCYDTKGVFIVKRNKYIRRYFSADKLEWDSFKILDHNNDQMILQKYNPLSGEKYEVVYSRVQ